MIDNNEMVDNNEIAANSEMAVTSELADNTERIFSFGTNESFVNDIKKSKELGLLTDVKFIKNYVELEAIIINLARYINENLSEKECEKRAKNFADQILYYLKEIPKTEQITFMSFFRNSPFAINIVKETAQEGNLSALFEPRYNFFRQFVLVRIEKGLGQGKNSDESSEKNIELQLIEMDIPDEVKKELQEPQLIEMDIPDEVKKELHNDIFRGNAFEVFKMYKEKKLITLQSANSSDIDHPIPI